MSEDIPALTLEIKKTHCWRRRAKFQAQYNKPWYLLNDIRDSMREINRLKNLPVDEFQRIAGLVCNHVRSERAKRAGKTRNARSAARKRALLEPKFL